MVWVSFGRRQPRRYGYGGYPQRGGGGGCLRDLLLLETGCCLAEALGCGPQLLVAAPALVGLARGRGAVPVPGQRAPGPPLLPDDPVLLDVLLGGAAEPGHRPRAEADPGPPAALPTRRPRRPRPGPGRRGSRPTAESPVPALSRAGPWKSPCRTDRSVATRARGAA